MPFIVFTEIMCSAPGTSVNSIAASDNPTTYTLNTKLKYECQFGYEQSAGDLVIVCMSDKQWSGPPPTCTGNA